MKQLNMILKNKSKPQKDKHHITRELLLILKTKKTNQNQTTIIKNQKRTQMENFYSASKLSPLSPAAMNLLNLFL
jgi:hypothetical protein